MLATSTPRGFAHYNLLLMTTSQFNTGTAAPVMLLVAILFTGFGGGAYASQGNAPKSRITVASNVRLRAEPNTSAAEIARLQIATVLKELERSPAKELIGGAEDYWYRVSTDDGKQGWLFGSLTAAFDPARRAETYLLITADRLKQEDLSFFDYADLGKFLSSAITEVTDRQRLAELELSRLIAMQKATVRISLGDASASLYKDWIKANEAELVYSEPAGAWHVKSDRFWQLQKKYSTMPIGERIAWEAASNPLGGECEGDTSCIIRMLNMTTGRFLSLYPKSSRADEVLAQIGDYLEESFDMLKDEPRLDAAGRAHMRKELTELRASLAKSSSPKRLRALALIDKYMNHYR